MAKKTAYRREFFDREYTAREAYGRAWGYARKYKLRVVLGIVCGMLTAGTLLPFFQMIQPTLSKVESRVSAKTDGGGAKEPANAPASAAESTPAQAAPARAQAAPAADAESAAAKKKAKGIEREYGKVRKWAEKLGVPMQSEDEALGMPLLLAIIIVVPLVALLRCALVFLNHYCLAWAGMRTVRDIRCDILRHVQSQSMQFHGRIDVGQLMSRCTSDPHQVQLVIQHVLQELAQAPFEIAVSVGFIVWSAANNNMLPTLGIIVIGFPMFMVPVVFLSKRIRKWSKKLSPLLHLSPTHTISQFSSSFTLSSMC